ncbi:hypothetical protein [Nocardioides sp. zg-1228]|uniref:hypothetical protein n=1 Tax=Nocardioides sp. zg-1228 TaxID=2763008 RepID=UPI0016434F2F|nr:hypothetical protein [Nocardioides sp. zg-1228]MBC2931521.1 hypothetical protein [Nocardioides sp. zg-1228]QSF57124.1 hypothetical protein JX575_16375 [Nocardioides sp. zg-1228]
MEAVERAFEGGGSVDFPGSTIIRITKVRGSDATYLVTKDVPRTVVRHGDGRREEFPGGRTTLRVVLEPFRKGWVVGHYWIEPS